MEGCMTHHLQLLLLLHGQEDGSMLTCQTKPGACTMQRGREPSYLLLWSAKYLGPILFVCASDLPV